MLIEQAGALEQFQWFVRAHLENASGEISTAGTHTEKSAAKSAAKRARR
jgi:starvation-inducible DNA-binding protein